MSLIVRSSIGAVLLLATCSTAQAVNIGYTEDFSSGDAGWRGRTTSELVSVQAPGGVGNSPYITHIPTSSTNAGTFVASTDPGGPSGAVIFRVSPSASGGAFTGNYLSSGVSNISAWVRHDFNIAPIDFYVRLPGTEFGQAAVFFAGQELAAGSEWTLLNFEISEANFTLAGAEGTTYTGVLQNATNFQIGAAIFANLTIPQGGTKINFGLDQVSIVPEPASAVMLVGLTLGAVMLRRRRHR